MPIQPLLAQQLSQTFGVAGEDDVARMVAGLAELHSDDPVVTSALRRFGEFLDQVGSAYAAHGQNGDAHACLTAASANELRLANERLRNELAAHRAEMDTLRASVSQLVKEADLQPPSEMDGTLAGISALLSHLVQERGRGRHELEQALDGLEQQKFALDQHAIVSITDVRGVITYVNDKMCEITGYSREELLGKTHSLINAGYHDHQFFNQMWWALSGGDVWRGEIRSRAKDGSLFWVQATIVPLLDTYSHPFQFIALRTDITAQKEAEEQLDAQLHLTRQLVESLPIPIYFKDTEGRYLGFNRAFEALLGISREDWVGRTVLDLVPNASGQFHLEKDAELLREGGTQRYEISMDFRSNERHDLIYHKAALTRPDGTIRGLIGTITDISERKRWEEELLKAKEQAESANRSKSEFLANMSHEIRTPMNGIIGMTELALDTELTAEQRDYLETVRFSAESLLTIINDILDFSKIEAGRLDIETISFSLDVLLDEVVKPLAIRAGQKGLGLRHGIEPGTPLHLRGDPGRIRQILVNLMGNAIKFTSTGAVSARVACESLTAESARLRFSVSDTGIGISPDKLELIFHAFSQEDSSTTRRYGGTGLGLTICRRLVELMGGNIWVESEPGHGSTFHFTLDLALDREAVPPAVSSGDLAGRQALVITNQEGAIESITEALQEMGLVVDVVDDGETGLRRLCQDGGALPDLLVLDADMPQPEGFGVAEHLRQEGRCPAATVMVSGSGIRGDAARCKALGIGAFLVRPFTRNEFGDTVRALMGSAPAELVTRHVLRERTRRLNVLVADDSPTNQRLVVGILEKLGHRAVAVGDGGEAVARFAAEPFDLVLMDLLMPTMDGMVAAQQIRESGKPPVPIVALSAFEADEISLPADKTLFDAFLGKPFRAKDLQLLLDRLVRSEPETDEFDFAAALRRADAEMVDIIGADYLRDWPAEMAAVRAAAEQGDWPVLERLAHTQKSIVGTFGAAPLQKDFSELEADARLRSLPDGTISRIEQKMARFAAALAAHIAG